MESIEDSVQLFIEFAVLMSNVSDTNDLICWNCLQRTPPGNCIHCDVLLSNPNDAFQDKKEDKEIKRIIELPAQSPNEENIRFNLDELVAVVEANFKIKMNLFRTSPQFVVEHPGTDLDQKFNQLVNDSHNLISGLKPMVEKYRGNGDLIIRYVYNIPPKPQEFRTIFILGIFTIVSIFFAGMYNASQLLFARNLTVNSGSTFFNIVLNLDTILSSLMYTGVLVFIIVLKDSVQLKRMFKKFSNNITPFYIPAPPIFELGTFGSINKQDHIHKNKEEMFMSTIIGPLIAWLASVLIILFSLPLATLNPDAAVAYSDHSIVANGRFEPLVLQLLVFLGNVIGLMSLDTTAPLTTMYILHPLTLAGLGGFYIASFSLLPAAHFNGGYVIRSSMGKRSHLLFTYLSIFAIYFIHWTFAIFVFFIHEILKSPQILNEESAITRNQRLLLIPFFLIIILSFPFDINVLNFLF